MSATIYKSKPSVVNKVFATGYYIAMTVLSVLFFYPMYWMIISSFKSNRQIFSSPFSFPKKIDLNNWVQAWKVGKMSIYALNSVITTSITVVVILIFAALAAFAFSKLEFRGSRLLLAMFVLGLFMPLQSYFIAQNYIFEYLNLKDTRLALIIPYVAMGLPLAVFLLKAHNDSLPKELLESSRMDGATDFTIFSRVMLPLMMPGLSSVAIFSALNSWNEFLLALLYIQNEKLKTIPTGLLAFSSRYMTNYHLLFSALSIVTIPMIVVYVLFHRHIVSGLTEGSLK
ncbi:carbohydrate ABC transporter permease [Paenibacillus sp. BC26]|uniref:carbohydrate ABC transporter permease n=1 Tax=Paenibacillus sp. BC26 TaxID=1881032 RepID=UPI0008EA0AAB|nr:carbohydrate ABC transporter permease [Paenibacillus sp. BC26]SFT20633.1 carbohydrate ABC transporter membrane protein 2, CUT1 family [Paenibacillus sp. BC26]